MMPMATQRGVNLIKGATASISSAIMCSRIGVVAGRRLIHVLRSGKMKNSLSAFFS